MSSPQSSQSPLAGDVDAPGEIELSCRLPLLVLFSGAAVWLLIGSGFALVSSIKFHSPRFLADTAWLTYGRVHAASRNIELYGVCLPAGLGVGAWLFARLGGALPVQRWLAAFGALLWNLGVALGILGILAGNSTGYPDLEMPGYATPLLCVAYLLLGLWSASIFHQRRRWQLYVSEWFLFAALFWFPWIFTTAELLLITRPVRGMTQAVVAWWFANNLQAVWLWLVGLAAIFYLLPKLRACNLHSRYLVLLAFWTVLLFGSWGGIPPSAPVPAWIPVLSAMATVMTVIPLLAVALSVSRTARTRVDSPQSAVQGQGSKVQSPKSKVGPGEGREAAGDGEALALRFILFGAGALFVSGLMRVLGALPALSAVTNLTWFTAAWDQLNNYGFFIMVMFGAAYYLLPRLVRSELPWAGLARAHFWLAATGILLVAVPEAVAGVIEGLKLSDPTVAFLDIARGTLPFLRVSTMGDLLMALGHLLFAVNLAGLIFGFYRRRVALSYATVTADLFKPMEVKA